MDCQSWCFQKPMFFLGYPIEPEAIGINVEHTPQFQCRCGHRAGGPHWPPFPQSVECDDAPVASVLPEAGMWATDINSRVVFNVKKISLKNRSFVKTVSKSPYESPAKLWQRAKTCCRHAWRTPASFASGTWMMMLVVHLREHRPHGHWRSWSIVMGSCLPWRSASVAPGGIQY